MATHAHPSPANLTVSMDDELRRRAFISSLTFDIKLEGFATREKLSVADLHIPRVRRSPYSDAPVSHLDVVSCWKGLSYSQATELILWERLFQQCLALQIRKRLQGVVIKHLDEVQKPANESVLLPQLVECLREKRPYRVGIDITTLIRDMIEAFYREYYDEAARPYFAWSQGSGNLPRFLYNFLRTQDCFLHTHSGECLTVDLLIPSHTDTFIILIANLAWQPPDVRFRDVPQKLQAGEQLCLPAPHVNTSLQSDFSNYSSMPDDTHHTIARSDLNLQWDSDRECFRGYVRRPELDVSLSTLCHRFIC